MSATVMKSVFCDCENDVISNIGPFAYFEIITTLVGIGSVFWSRLGNACRCRHDDRRDLLWACWSESGRPRRRHRNGSCWCYICWIHSIGQTVRKLWIPIFLSEHIIIQAPDFDLIDTVKQL
jgi:hypothetical protein